MVSRGVRRVVAAIGALALASVVGCSGDANDSGDDPSDRSSRAEAPEPPAAMSGSDARAAKAFITYYWAVMNHAESSGDTATLRDLAGDECGACDDQATRIETIHDAGGSIDGGDATVKGLQVLDGSGTTTYDVIVDLAVTKGSVTESKDAEPVAQRARYDTLDFTVSHDGGQWQVDQWQSPAPE